MEGSFFLGVVRGVGWRFLGGNAMESEELCSSFVGGFSFRHQIIRQPFFFSERNEGVLEVFLENAALLVCSCNHFGIFVALQW